MKSGEMLMLGVGAAVAYSLLQKREVVTTLPTLAPTLTLPTQAITPEINYANLLQNLQTQQSLSTMQEKLSDLTARLGATPATIMVKGEDKPFFMAIPEAGQSRIISYARENLGMEEYKAVRDATFAGNITTLKNILGESFLSGVLGNVSSVVSSVTETANPLVETLKGEIATVTSFMADAEQKIKQAAAYYEDKYKPKLPDVVYYEKTKGPVNLGQILGIAGAGSVAGAGFAISKIPTPQAGLIGGVVGGVAGLLAGIGNTLGQSGQNWQNFTSNFPVNALFLPQTGGR